MMDAGGGMGYRIYADKVLYDISGLDKVATKIMASKNPNLAAARFIEHPISRNLARIFYDNDCHAALQALNDLVVCAYQAAQISMKPKRKITSDDQRAWTYLRKLYKNGINAIRENYGYDRSAKNMYKEQFADLRNYSKGYGGYGGHFLPIMDDDDEDEDDLDLFDEDPRATMQSIQKRTPMVPVDDDSLYGTALEDLMDDDEDDLEVPSSQQIAKESARIKRLREELQHSQQYDANKTEDLDYDFSGKVTLETISDRMESVVEGLELIISRLYGRPMQDITGKPEASTADDDALYGPDSDVLHVRPMQDIPEDTEPSEEPDKTVEPGELFDKMLRGDFSMLSTQECIKIYNGLSNRLTMIVDSTPEEDHTVPVEDHPDQSIESQETPDQAGTEFTMSIGDDEDDSDSDTEEDDSTSDDAATDVTSSCPTVADMFNAEQDAQQSSDQSE